MSPELFDVLSLAARYVFALLGILIVLNSFLALLSRHSEHNRRSRRLRNADRVGELVVISGSPALPDGSVLPVPWEGILGSVRSCDIVVPASGIRREHLAFSWEPDLGLVIRPLSGCEAMVDSVSLNVRSKDSTAPMRHGSFLQVGSALLRLRVLAGLDSAAGFKDDPVAQEQFYQEKPQIGAAKQYYPVQPQNNTSEQYYPVQPQPYTDQPQPYTDQPQLYTDQPQPYTDENQSASPEQYYPIQPQLYTDENQSASPDQPIHGAPAPELKRRRRRSDRWEEDWSE